MASFFRTITSGFRAINRMGDVQSSEAVPDQDTADTTASRLWSPEDATDSSDEVDTIVVNSGPPEPEPPPQRAENSQRDRSRRSSAKSSLSNGSNDQSSSPTTVVTPATRGLTTSPFSQKTIASNANESSDSQRTTRSGAKRNEFKVEEGNDIEVQQDHTRRGGSLTQQEELLDISEPELASSAKAIVVKRLQVRPKPDNARFPCPEAEKYGCEKTFASERIAKRHVQTHSGPQNLQCPVCFKTLSRVDKLNKHKMTHSRSEIAEAIASQASQQEKNTETTGDPSDLDDIAAVRVGEEEESVHDIEDPVVSTPKASGNALVAQSSDAIMSGTINHSSADASATSASVFDESIDKDVVEETPRPKSRLKRKRISLNPSSGGLPNNVSSKRRRRNSLSPPTSVASADEEEAEAEKRNEDVEAAVLASVPAKNINKAFKARNLDSFVQAWTPESQLHHPIYNPRSPRVSSSQRVQVVLPETARAGPSTKSAVKLRNKHLDDVLSGDDDGQTSSAGRTVYTSPKGKRKAEAGITYSSPPLNIPEDEASEEIEETGLATSVARRSSSTGEFRQLPKKAKKQKRSTKADDPESDATGDQKTFRCKVCQRKFFTENALSKHQKKPNVHEKLRDCDDCSQKFASSEALKTHQQATGHGDGTGYAGRKGAFSPGEVRKLHKWRDNFCQDNDINMPTFNQMMTDSLRRTKGFQWPYRFISRVNFLQEYYDILPDRNRRSMHRYRERAFQNVPTKQEWTPEDDEELEQLVKELGPRWVEIGQRMTRTQDSVNQRWRFKLQYKGKIHQGEWSATEEQMLRVAVAEVKKESGLPSDPYADVRLSWDSVCKKLKEKRTAQQCSNKWRLMTHKRAGNKFLKPNEIGSSSATPVSTATPSRMSQRLSGQTPSKSSAKKYFSEEFVQDSDDSTSRDKDEEEAEASDADSTVDSDQLNDGRPYKGNQSKSNDGLTPFKTPSTRTKGLPSKTPKGDNSLSQVFAQTQANTSALRAPSTSRKHHTQPEMPTPGIPIQRRPNPSPWRVAHRGSMSADGTDDGLVEIEAQQTASDEEDAVMAEPESSDAGSRSTRNTANNLLEIEESETSESNNVDDDDEDIENGNEAEADSSKSDSPSESEADSSGESESEETEDNSAKANFLQSLRSSQPPNSRVPSSSNIDRYPGPRGSQGKPNWDYILGEQAQQDSSSSSEDEGDIAHH